MADEIPAEMVEQKHYEQESAKIKRKLDEGTYVTKDMTIGEAVETYPEIAEVLYEAGVHCVGCGAAFWETIEQGLMGHGRSDEEINKVVADMNTLIKTLRGE